MTRMYSSLHGQDIWPRPGPSAAEELSPQHLPNSSATMFVTVFYRFSFCCCSTTFICNSLASAEYVTRTNVMLHETGCNDDNSSQFQCHFLTNWRGSLSPDFTVAVAADTVHQIWQKKCSYSVWCQVSSVWLFICVSVCVSSLFCCFIHMAAYRPPWTRSTSCLNKRRTNKTTSSTKSQ